MPRTIDDRAALDFALMLRRRWADVLYPQLRAEFDAAPAAGAIAETVHGLASYPLFAWTERGAQQMMWRAVSDAVAADDLPEATNGPATLQLDPELMLPAWYTGTDIHLQPGGIWSSAASARIYELGAQLVMLGENDDYAFHCLFTATAVPARVYRSIVDLGCGFGKSTWSLKQTFPTARVIGVDIAAPCLALARQLSDERGLAIDFVQADASSTKLAAGSVDLVTATMLIHELPLDHLTALFAEIARILQPGGQLRILDFHATGDAFRDLAMIEHGVRNLEPFMPPMMAADTVGMAVSAGLTGVGWQAFDERGTGLLPDLTWPRRREWHFPWAVLSAGRPR